MEHEKYGQTKGPEPGAAFVGVAGNASVLFSTITHIDVPTVNVGQGDVGLSFHNLKSLSAIPNLGPAEIQKVRSEMESRARTRSLRWYNRPLRRLCNTNYTHSQWSLEQYSRGEQALL